MYHVYYEVHTGVWHYAGLFTWEDAVATAQTLIQDYAVQITPEDYSHDPITPSI